MLIFRNKLLPLLGVYLLCCQYAVSQELATAEDFPQVDKMTSADERYRVALHFGEFDELNQRFNIKLSLEDLYNNNNVFLNTGVDPIIYSWNPIISADGKFVVFHTWREGDGYRLYRHDIDNGETILVSIDEFHSTPFFSSISADGRYVAHKRFDQTSLYLYDSLDSSQNIIGRSCGGVSESDISPDGQYVAYVSQCDGEPAGLFLYDHENRTNMQLDTKGVSVRHVRVDISENNQYVRFNVRGSLPGDIYDRILDDVYRFGTTGCVDSDGDGWGFNEYLGESCLIEQLTQSGCDYSNANLYGGWGWNATTRQSCAPLENVSNTQPAAQCVDADGDGYGWDGTATCIINDGNQTVVTTSNGNCDYSDAHLYGGWGWNAIASQSCAPLENVSNSQPTGQCVDTDGDGWGWDGTASCIP